ncbi:MAG: FAD binding domain-containing protein [Proteobacteria bacterium]|jgi:carbon-monoxide dehydrogenase medium subunit|nr:FAD binding domain-containing protein [Pseudomonadota bacterium]
MYAFNYLRPADVAAAAAALTGESRYLAGGQSLVQSMKLRLASAENLVDLGGIASLTGIEVDAQGVTIGAMTTHAQVAASAEVRQAIPALAALAGGIGDTQVRNMGTIGGSVANADPAADYPAALLGLGATVHTHKRRIAADGFFKGLYETALESGELITAVQFPRAARAAYVKFKQPASRFALVGVFVSQGAGGVRVAVTGAKAAAYRDAALEAALARSFTPEAAQAVKVSADGMNADLHASAEYRAAMVSVMAARAVAAANAA